MDAALRERDEQLVRAQKLEVVGQLAGGVAHDFNNMLTAVLTCSALLRDHVDGDADANDLLGELEGAVERASILTSQLLSFSRGLYSDPRRVEVSAAMGAQTKMIRRLLSGHQLVVEIPDHLGTVLIDPIQLQQIVLNLVVNARDAAGPGGFIAVRACLSEGGGAVRLMVEDDGPGVPVELRNRVFEPFFTTKGERGTGLDLATVANVVARAHGSVWLEEAPRGGARFVVELSLTEGETDPDLVQSAPEPQPLGGAETVLLVEDEPTLRRVLFSQFDRLGYRTYSAESRAEARRIVDSFDHLDLVVSDVMLRGDRGTDVARDVRAAFPDAHVVLIPGFVNADVAADLGDHALLREPFAPAALLRLVRRLLNEAGG